MEKTAIRSKIPLDIGNIYFCGIGGIGMSGIAEILHNLGYKVAGSDMAESANVERLRKLGITVNIGQKEKNIKDVAVVVRSSAVKDNNPEIAAARLAGIPVVRRAEMLAEIMRLKQCVSIAGTHGKTTTTTMMATMFDAAGIDPTVINGGIINAYGTNARLGKGEWLIAEADESDGTFVRVPSTIGVITNIDPEHMEYYGTFDNLRDTFKTFIENLPFYGFGVLCADHREVAAMAPQITDRRIYTYGIEKSADVQAKKIRHEKGVTVYDVHISARVPGGKRVLKGVRLPMPGMHNISNSLAVLTVALGMKFPDKVVQTGLEHYAGVKRRFTTTGVVDGITVIDDYGHHPKEIACTLATAREVVGDNGKIIAVLQPHRFSRVKDLFKEFATCLNEADEVLIADIYAAGESPVTGITKEALVDAIAKQGHDAVRPLASEKALASIIHNIASSGDMVVCLGAGSVTYWAQALPQQLAELRNSKVAV